MNFQIETSVSVLTVFLQGLLSFFSPCVLPLLPVYIGYLSGGTGKMREDGTVYYPVKKVLQNTLFFVIGISAAFFLLGLGFTAIGQFFSGYRYWFAKISGILIILFGLYQLGALGKPLMLMKEHRLPFAEKLAREASINPLTALLLGFTFSFAWTPCVGPVLGSVLLMAGSSASMSAGFGLIGAYTLGFVVPFLLTGAFAGSLLNLFRKHIKVVQYTVKIGGAILILMGIMIFTGWMNSFTSYLSSLSGSQTVGDAQQITEATEESDGEEAAGGDSAGEEERTGAAASAEEDDAEAGEKKGGAASQQEEEASANNQKTSEKADAPDFTLVDQFGETHTLSDYKGKTVFLNFWATWCGPCQREMPDIQALYEEYGENTGELIVLGVANPKTEDYPNSSDGTVEEVTAFLTENGYDYPVVMDSSGEIFGQYGISAFPTTFMISADGKVYGYVTGSLSADIIDSIVTQTMESVS